MIHFIILNDRTCVLYRNMEGVTFSLGTPVQAFHLVCLGPWMNMNKCWIYKKRTRLARRIEGFDFVCGFVVMIYWKLAFKMSRFYFDGEYVLYYCVFVVVIIVLHWRRYLVVCWRCWKVLILQSLLRKTSLSFS